MFFRETVPPREVMYKGTILLIHGQSFSSSTWQENSTMQVVSRYHILNEIFLHPLAFLFKGIKLFKSNSFDERIGKLYINRGYNSFLDFFCCWIQMFSI